MHISFKGVNNVADPSNLAEVISKSGDVATYLTEAVNVVQTRDGFLLRRPGYGLVHDQPFHSLYFSGYVLLGVYEGVLYRDVASNPTPLLLLASNARMNYQTFQNGWTVFSNGVDIGYFDGATAQPFPAPPQSYVDEAGNSVPTFLADFPAAVAVEHLWGMLFLLCQFEGEAWLVHSEPWDLSGYRPTDSYQRWAGTAQLLVAVDDGLYVGAGDKIYWSTYGDDAQEVGKAEYGAIPGTAAVVQVNKTPWGEIMQGEKCALAVTTQGVLVMGNGGVVLNLTHGKIDFPVATSGTGVIQERDGQVRYLFSLFGATTTAWCLDLSSGLVTEYRNYPFTSTTDTYASSPAGVFLLTGDDDNGTPIEAHVITGDIELSVCRLEDVVLDVAGNDLVGVTVAVDQTDTAYSCPVKRNNSITQRAKVPRGLKGRYWTFIIGNSYGAPMVLKGITVKPQKIRRSL